MTRMLTDYSKLEKEIPLLNREDLLNIELGAGALSIEQCLDTLGIEIADVPEAEMKLIVRVHKLGRAKSIAGAFTKLNSAMGGRNGGQIALELLKARCTEFSLVQADALPASAGNGFAFNVIMPDAEAKD